MLTQHFKSVAVRFIKKTHVPITVFSLHVLMADGGSGLQDDELYLPRSKSCVLSVMHLLHWVSLAAVVNKLIKEIVPNIRVSTDARDLLLNCCTGQHC